MIRVNECIEERLSGGEISAKTSSARSQKKMLRAFFCFSRYAELRAGFAKQNRGSSNLSTNTKNTEQMLGIFRGGGGEIRTPATDLSILTI